MSVSIIIPYRNGWSLSHQLLYDLYRNDRDNIQEVMLVDDASDDTDCISGIGFWKKLFPVRLYRFDENVGFLRSANKGLRKATKDIKILISNDVRIHQSFIPEVISLLSKNPKQLVGNVFHSGDTGWNTFGNKTFPYLAGHFLCSTTDTWECLEYFDELYVPHTFEDVDISTKALSMEIKLTSLNHPGIVHTGGQTIKYDTEREKLTIVNKEKFKCKWIK
jgi:glycosyltransferase involved in cell wall biosynthesis